MEDFEAYEDKIFTFRLSLFRLKTFSVKRFHHLQAFVAT